MLEPGAGSFVDVQQGPTFFGLALLLGRGIGHLGQRDFKLLSHGANGLGEGDVLHTLDEAEDVSRCFAAETVIKLLRCMDGERGGLLLMEGTKPKEVLRTSLAQPDVFAHDADDVSLLFDRVCKIAGISHLTIVCSKGKREWHRIQVAAVDSLWNFPESGAWCWITRPCAVIPHHTGFRFEIVPSKTIRRENPDTLQRIEGEKIEVAST